VQNAFIASFNGKFRDECSNQNWFVSPNDARQIIENWRVDYKTVRPHRSLGYLTPEEFVAGAAARPASPPHPPTPAGTGSSLQKTLSVTL
jgi:transposase InsO family protein